MLKKSNKILSANKNDDLMRFIIILKLLNILLIVINCQSLIVINCVILSIVNPSPIPACR